ncbi:MAG: PhnA domain-containing protein [Chitinophagales bacterium]
MSIDNVLQKRSGLVCELCGSTDDIAALEVNGGPNSDINEQIVTCATCRQQINEEVPLDPNHWRCLNDSMWSEVPAVQVMAYRMLNRLNAEGWARDLLDMMYLDDDTKAWAKAGMAANNAIVHIDSNGNILQRGDTVVITETLKVKGSSVTAKRGTSVRNISLVHDNAEQIEGRVDGQQIVILTKYVKKSK